MPLRRIRLELARTADFPDGSPAHGYEFVAPLDDAGALDATGWKRFRQACTVRRFWGDEAEQQGLLIHRPDGQWAFSYEKGEADDEPIFRFDRHRFAVDEYVTISEQDGQAHPFRVVAVSTPPALRRA